MRRLCRTGRELKLKADVTAPHASGRFFAWCAFICAAVFTAVAGYNVALLVISVFGNIALLDRLIFEGFAFLGAVFRLCCFLFAALRDYKGRIASGIASALISAIAGAAPFVWALSQSRSFSFISLPLSLLLVFVVIPVWLISMPLCTANRRSGILAGITGAIMALLNIIGIVFMTVLRRLDIIALFPETPFFEPNSLFIAASECLPIAFAVCFFISSLLRHDELRYAVAGEEQDIYPV